ncbi:MAG: hypothetical protein U0325_34720 [Polyangiales bacterium]
MKYAQGETLERIIERLRANDPVYVGRFPHETRARRSCCSSVARCSSRIKRVRCTATSSRPT